LTPRTLASRLRDLEKNFPELGDDALGKTAKWVILPQLVRAAEKDPIGLELRIVSFTRRFVNALEIPLSEIFAAEVADKPATD
jgi:hypothetical protein